MDGERAAAPGLRVLLTLAWPVIIARSAQAVIGFTDALMTAQLDSASLAAVTTGAMNVLGLVILPMGVVFIGQSFAAQLYGEGDLVAARRYGWYGLVLAGVFGAIAVAVVPLLDVVLAVFSFTPQVHAHLVDYMAIRLLAVGPAVGAEALGAWYGGLGNTRIHMMAAVVSMVANVFLNWVLIFGNLGAPALGVQGAAWASSISVVVGLAVPLIAFVRRWQLELEPGRVRLQFGELVRFLRFGLPSGVTWFLEFAAFVLFINVVVAHLGTAILGAVMVVISINKVSFMPAFGISTAGSILAGQSIGSGRSDDVPIVLRRTLLVTSVWQGTVGLAYLLWPEAIFSWFEPPDGDPYTMKTLGPKLLMISAAWQLADAASMSTQEVLRAAGDTLWCMLAGLVLAWLVFVPLASVWVLVLGGGAVAALLSMAGYLTVLATVLLLRFRSGRWRVIELTGTSSATDTSAAS